MKGYRMVLVMLSLLLMVAPVGSPGLAQGADPPAAGMGDVTLAGTVAERISYQGYLEQGGSPMNGSVDLTFTLYSDDACSAVVDTIVKNGVSVSEGYFTTELDVTQDNFNGQGLWVGVAAGGNDLGCQEIVPVPYALSLRPGAIISTSTWLQQFPHVQGSLGSSTVWKLGDVKRSGMPPMVDSVYGVRGHAPGGAVDTYGVEGSAEATFGHKAYGVYGSATATEAGGVSYGVYGLGDYGVYGRTDSSSGYGGYFVNTDDGVDIEAAGSGIIKSAAETDIAVSPLKTVVDPLQAGNPEVRPHFNGNVVLRPTASAERFAYLPVDLPSQLFGVSQKLESITVCYYLDQSSSYINDLFVYYTDDDGRVELIFDPTNRTSTSWDCYTVSDPSPGVIEGPVFLRFDLQYGGTGSSHEIHIGKIVLTLVE